MAAHKPLEEVLESFVEAVGVSRDATIVFGGRGPAAEPTAEQRKHLLTRLTQVGSDSRTIVWVWIAVIIATFVLAAGLAVVLRHDVKYIAGTILGGTGIMAALMKQLQSVHREFVSTQICLAMLPNLPPKEWVRTAMVLVDEILKGPRK